MNKPSMDFCANGSPSRAITTIGCVCEVERGGGDGHSDGNGGEESKQRAECQGL